MKKVLILVLVLSFVIISAWNNKAYTNASGPPPSVSGGRGESDCSSCHFNGPSGTVATITSDIDTSGYIPGKIYHLTATVSNPTQVKFGFEVTAFTSGGLHKGTLTVVDNVQTQFAYQIYGAPYENINYTTHRQGGISSSNHSKTWTIQWTAPISGTGGITFYGAFLAANGDGSQSGDAVQLANSAVKEKVSSPTGIAIEGAAAGKIGIYPNPARETLHYTIVLDKMERVNAAIISIDGRIAKGINNEVMPAGTHHLNADIAELPAGIYLMNVNTDGKNYVQKFIIQ